VRHGTAQHIAAATRPPRLGITAAVLAAWRWSPPVAFGMMDRTSDELRATRGLAATTRAPVSTRAAQQANLALDARTQAALQPDTRLTTPADFGPRLRVVALEGAALFTAGSGRPPLEVRSRPRRRCAARERDPWRSAPTPTRAAAPCSCATAMPPVRTGAGSQTLGAGPRGARVAAAAAVTPLDGVRPRGRRSW
jgi:hypothetical protein